MDLISSIISSGCNHCKYGLNIADVWVIYWWAENLYQKRETNLALWKYVIFIEIQTKWKVKCLKINQDKKFGIYELETKQVKKRIRIKFNITYYIVERTNSLIILRAGSLLLDLNIN